MIKQIHDVTFWNKTANNGFLPSDKQSFRQWQAGQLPHYLSELAELDKAIAEDDENEIIDGIFDVMWTSYNFLAGQMGHDIEQCLSADMMESYKEHQEHKDVISNAVTSGNVETTCYAAVSQAYNMIEFAKGRGYDVDKMWKIGSASNWAKFAKYKSDALASQRFYIEQKGVNTKIHETHDYFVLKVENDQYVEGKDYPDGKIMKCGRVFMGKYVKWIDPEWSEALNVSV